MDISPLENLINSKLNLKHHLHLKNARLNKDEQALFLDFSYPELIREEEKTAVYNVVKDNLPPYIKRIKVNIEKLFADEESVKSFLLKNIAEKYPLLDSSIDKSIDVKKTLEAFKITIKCDESAVDYAEKVNAKNKLTDDLKAEFFDNFAVSFEKEKIIDIQKIKEERSGDDGQTYEQSLSRRVIEVVDVAPLCGSLTDNLAFYIGDIKQEMSPCVICGTLTNFSERTTKNGKAMFTFDVTDFTGKLRCLHFPAKSALKKLGALEDGIEVLIGGNIKEDNFNGGLCMMASNISLCKLPDKFIEGKPNYRKESQQYKTIFPKKVSQATQGSLFETVKVNRYFENKTFVVFDIETTGLNVRENAKVTEIGAVKIVNGVITESFSTLIDPQVSIPEEITRLTGITDEMVKDKPKIEEVIPDFYKFTRDCVLVAHNAEFDVEFIKFFAKALNYNFDNQVLDTVKIGRSKIRLTNYKLQTLAEALKVPLKNHHRAVDDAAACAEIFLKLNA